MMSAHTVSRALSLLTLSASVAYAQQTPFERLPTDRFDVVAPSARVAGPPGRMTVRTTTCRTLPSGEVRRRIVDVAVQEWAFFGFSVLDQTAIDDADRDDADEEPRPRRRRRLDPEQAARVADSIAGYWTATPEGSWIVGRQNQEWSGPDGIAARWRYPWSAAFVSWVMCEAGLGAPGQFQRAVAHHVYIDQAIRARAAGAPSAAFVAYEAGEATVEPGDLLCSARRPAYRTLAERRRQMGEGARTHCDVVVKADVAGERLFAIGGNVRGLVSLKLLPAARVQGALRSRTGFAHLKLRATPIEADALDGSPTMRAIGCAPAFQRLASPALANLEIRRDASCRSTF